MIECYIKYYNNKRLQRNLGVVTPMKKHKEFYCMQHKNTSRRTGWQKDFYFSNCLLDGEHTRSTAPSQLQLRIPTPSHPINLQVHGFHICIVVLLKNSFLPNTSTYHTVYFYLLLQRNQGYNATQSSSDLNHHSHI